MYTSSLGAQRPAAKLQALLIAQKHCRFSSEEFMSDFITRVTCKTLHAATRENGNHLGEATAIGMISPWYQKPSEFFVNVCRRRSHHLRATCLGKAKYSTWARDARHEPEMCAMGPIQASASIMFGSRWETTKCTLFGATRRSPGAPRMS